MKKILTKILATTLICTVAFTSTVQKVSANDNDSKIKTIINNNDEKVVETTSDDFKFRCTNDKKNNDITMEKYSLKTGGLLLTVVLDNDAQVITVTDAVSDSQTTQTVSEVINGALIPENQAISNTVVQATSNYSIMATTANQNTFSNYEYTKTYGSPNVWELRRPDGSLNGTYYFKTNETSTNRNYLTAFYDAVESINSTEGKLIGSLGLAVFTSALSVVIMCATEGLGEPLAAYLSSLGFSGTTISLSADLGDYCSKAKDNYYNTYNCSSVFY
ncbi:hypothetical protein SAMN02745136_05717 [Anaerocolumna jejuensis DSM 15929]|uniref:Uncharacterized protein n=1 Tax=Anaerocolumna jejuensis DSM 15929 TaxID=1121322 RepID=A0A1M7DK16_9FIRM|nr:geobacillin-26 family protein [Anaerocolumna jejuensis]SHL79737.1 hypothetical protein SAMN02745136_05717 [Anaerocolumna jejuensis DSM 15929]